MNKNKNESSVPGSSIDSKKMDLLFFKDDILKDLRAVQKTLDEKNKKTNKQIN